MYSGMLVKVLTNDNLLEHVNFSHKLSEPSWHKWCTVLVPVLYLLLQIMTS